MTAAHLDVAAVERLLTRRMALTAARESARLHAKGAVVTGRTSVRVGDTWIRVLVAALPGRDEIGYKEFHVSHDPPTIRYMCHLFRLSSGEPIGTVDAGQITQYRTAATAALACEHVFGSAPVRVGMVGSGGEAREGLYMLSAVLDITDARVFSPRAASRERFVADMCAATGLNVRDTPTLAACIEGVDLLYAATDSKGRIVLEADDLDGLAMLATLGSTIPTQREVQGLALARATPLVVDTLDALDESGDLIEASDTAALSRESIVLLGDFLEQPLSRPVGSHMIAYKSIGSAEQDLVLASDLLARAVPSVGASLGEGFQARDDRRVGPANGIPTEQEKR